MNTLDRIVVAYDGSAYSKKALEWTTKIANCSVIIDVVMVLTPSVIFGNIEDAAGYTAKELKKTAEIEAAKKMAIIHERCTTQGLQIQTTILFGNIVDEILKYADESKATMIICGTRGIGGFKGLLVGSIAHRLVTYSQIPVLIVK